MSELILTKREEAAALDAKIMRSGNELVVAYVDFALNLKEMRDKKLYIELGYEDFKDYTENRVGLKQTQAYTWIQSIEKLGTEEFQKLSGFGITKVRLLAELYPQQREEFIENHNVEDMSTRALKEEISKLKAELAEKADQLTLFAETKEQVSDSTTEVLKRTEAEKFELETDLTKARLEIERLKGSVDELKTTLSEQIMKETEEKYSGQIENLKKKVAKAEESALRKYDSQKKEEIDKAVKEAVKKAKADAEKANKLLSEENERALKRAKELESKLKISASPESTEFSIYFKSLKDNLNSLSEVMMRIPDEETRSKLKENMIRFSELIKSRFEAM